MTKILFKPFSMLAGLLAGRTSSKLVNRMWSGERPKAEQRTASWGRLAGALAIEGAIFRAASGLADHAARRWFQHLTGRWPGEKKPEAPDEPEI